MCAARQAVDCRPPSLPPGLPQATHMWSPCGRYACIMPMHGHNGQHRGLARLTGGQCAAPKVRLTCRCWWVRPAARAARAVVVEVLVAAMVRLTGLPPAGPPCGPHAGQIRGIEEAEVKSKVLDHACPASALAMRLALPGTDATDTLQRPGRGSQARSPGPARPPSGRCHRL